ncbi:MAG: DNA double-strand break repair nuclease NurA [Dictyoglomus thermophilum]|uniref:DNA double-strand break repair nuclease NurA n=1 Tax=Dictyoglomus thermophilum TaxID=14 RepID=A0A7V3ZI82_DICTH|nr:DNA double-strand break repair nuclease NurA [Dictyoglomus thermophilum]MCX7720381.1 DNA double-strand break repair nuclease NurA [Dictyoglomus thermophilum]TYT24477.1 DNA double-strand break repair nuclease NurA [Dictyoglomus thermophilum]
MPDFISLFISEIKKKRPILEELLLKRSLSDKSFVSEFIGKIWNKLSDSYQFTNKPTFAVDASQRTLSFSLGPYLIITQALAIGSNGYEKALVSLEPVWGSIPETQLGLLRDLLMQDLEIRLALQIIKENKASLRLFIDGSLLSRISYLLRYLHSFEDENYKNLAREVLMKTLDLINSSKNNVDIISISKSSRNTFLFQILSLDNPDIDKTTPYKPTDSEILSIFTSEPGYTTPLLIGAEMGLGHKQLEIIEKDPDLQNILNNSPAFYTFYIRLMPRDQFLRIDFPANMVGEKSSILSVNYFWGKDINIDQILGVLRENCVNTKIYQTPLYFADQIVRIKREPDLERYIMILKTEFPGIIELDRSQGRFY